MLIIGFGVTEVLLSTLVFTCETCGNHAAHQLTKPTRKFSLFFIPLFSVGTKYLDSCTACGRIIEAAGQAQAAARQAMESPRRESGWSLAAACQPELGTAPVRTSSSATSRSFVLVCWEAWVRMVNASSSLILCRSIKMPLACSIRARAIIAMRS